MAESAPYFLSLLIMNNNQLTHLAMNTLNKSLQNLITSCTLVMFIMILSCGLYGSTNPDSFNTYSDHDDCEETIDICETDNSEIVCSISLSATVSDCYFNSSNQSRATVSIEIAWDDANISTAVNNNTDLITVSFNGQTRTINPGPYNITGIISSIVSPQVVAFEIDADGTGGYSASGTFANDGACIGTSNVFSAPNDCGTLLCNGNNTGGTVYQDFDNDGDKDPGEVLGIQGVTIEAYNSNGTLAGTSTTDINGDYTFSSLTSADYPIRVEFSNLPAIFDQGTFSGADGQSLVQFISAPSCNTDLGVLDPNDFCQADPLTVTSCFVYGEPTSTFNVNDPALVGVQYDFGPVSPKVPLATTGQIGTVWGVAYDKFSERLYSSAFVRRFSGLRDAGLGGIYITDMNIALPNGSLLVDVETLPGVDLGTIESNNDRGLSTAILQNIFDVDGFNKVGKAGIGGIDLSVDGETLFFVNMHEKKLHRIDVNNPVAAPSVDIPDPGCVNGEMRPWAVTIYNDYAYVGVVCDASTSIERSDLRAYVYKYELATNTFDTNPVFDFPLTYPKGLPVNGLNSGSGWFPWTDDPNISFIEGANGTNTSHPMPVLSDIEFDLDGGIVLGFLDRFGMQTGTQNLRPDATSVTDTKYYNFLGGDILRGFVAGNSFVLENAGKVGSLSGSAPANNQGPGFGEFYFDNWRGNAHSENGQGGLAIRPGSGEVIVTSMDAVEQNPINAGGYRKLSNVNGSYINAVTIVQGTIAQGVFAKSSSLGDVDLHCDLPDYLQIGNLIWDDTDRDGVQDPGESAIAGVAVSLYSDDGAGNLTLEATTISNSAGNYFFTEADYEGESWVDTAGEMLPNTDYKIVFGYNGITSTSQYTDTEDKLTINGLDFFLTASNTGEGTNPDFNDSDATEVSIAGGTYPSISLTTGDINSVDHTYDAGFWYCPKINSYTTDEPNCVGENLVITIGHDPNPGTMELLVGPAGLSISDVYAGTGLTSLGTATPSTQEITTTNITINPLSDLGPAGTYTLYTRLQSPSVYLVPPTCEPVYEANITIAAVGINGLSSTNEICPGANDGTVAVDACGNNPADLVYSINGVDFQPSNTFTDLAPITYTVTVRDVNDIAVTATANITVGAGSDFESPTIACIPEITLILDKNGEATLDPALTGATATDNCTLEENLTYSLTQSSFDCTNLETDAYTNLSSLDFDGSNDYLTIPGTFNNTITGNQITVEGWINYSSASQFASIVSEAFLGDNNVRFFIGSDNGTNWRAGFYSPGWTWTGFFTVPYNEWTHVAATYDQTAIIVYVNGVQVQTLNSTNPLPVSNEEWRIGRRWDLNNIINGQIDEVRIWNTARTQAEIQANMNTTLLGNETNLAGYWPMEDGAGSTIATDESPNANDAVLTLMDPATDWVSGAAELAGKGSQVVVLTVTDEAGNSSTCTTQVSVESNAPPGSYFDVATCEPVLCPMGTYCPGGTTEPIPCAAGEFQGLEGQSTCLPCAAGSFNPDLGQIACSLCPLGTSQGDPGQTECISCPPGTISDVVGAEACTDCPAGTFNPVSGNIVCTLCPLGTSQGSPGQSECISCPPGTISDIEGAEACTDCPAGTFNPVSGNIICTLCPVDTYNPIPGQSECLDCPVGSNSDEGQTECIANNAPPVAICMDITVEANSSCEGVATAEDFNDNSTDPDAGDVLTYSVDPAGPYAFGTTPVVLTVTDQDGLFSTCDASITVPFNDNDLDGICDEGDLDDDNDGILDSDECDGVLLVEGFVDSALPEWQDTKGDATAGEPIVFSNIESNRPEVTLIGGPFDGLTVFLTEHGGNWGSFSDPALNQSASYDVTAGTVNMANWGIESAAYLGLGNILKLTWNIMIDVNGDGEYDSADGDEYLGAFSPQSFNNLPTPTVSGDVYLVFFDETNSNSNLNNTTVFSFISEFSSATCDTDNDGIDDQFDLDSDGDNCSDANEAYADQNADGGDGAMYGTENPTLGNGINSNGLVIAAGLNANGDAYLTTPAIALDGRNTFQAEGALSIIENPSDQTISVGGTATFTATAESALSIAVNSVSYLWQVSTDGGINFIDIPGETGIVASGDQVSYTTPAISDCDATNEYRVVFPNNTNICVNGITSPATLIVEDNEDPSISCPINIVEDATSAAGVIVAYTTPVGTDNCGASTVQTAGFPSGSPFPIGTTTNTFEVTDDAGNMMSCSFDITVSGLLPEIVCPADIVASNDAGFCETAVTFEATETVGIPASVIIYSHAPGSAFPIGTTTVTATATNAVGSDVCTFDITVEDTEDPIFTSLPADVTVNCEDGVPVIESATADDNCWSTSITTQDVYATGNISTNGLLGAWAFDEVSGTNLDDVLMTSAGDIQGASINRVPGQFTGNAVQFSGSGTDKVELSNSSGGALDAQYTVSMFAWIIPGTNGAVSMPILGYDPGNGEYGVHIWQTGANSLFFRPTVRGSNGFMNFVVSNVLVPEEWNLVGASYDYTTGKTSLYHNGIEVNSIINPINEISTDSPINMGHRIGDSRQTNATVDNALIYNRILSSAEIAEMYSSQCPQSFTVNRFYNAEDLAGNTTVDVQQITVVDEEAPVIVTCPVVNLTTEPGLCTAVATYEAIATDNCADINDIVLEYSIPSGSVFQIGTTDVTVTATDECGNVSDVCTISVTVEDNEAPEAICQNITISLDENGEAIINATDIDNGSNDNCGTVDLGISNTDFGCNTANYALAFDGQNDHVVMPDGMVDGLGDFTFETWVNYVDNGFWTRIMDIGINTQFNMFLTPKAARQPNIGRPRLAITVAGIGGEQIIDSNIPMPTGWHHIAITLDKDDNTGVVTGIMYIDGNIVGTNNNMTLTPDDLGMTTQNLLGRSQYPDPYFRQYMDETRIWSTARTQAQIQAQMNSALSGNEIGLFLYYDYEDGPGSTTITDKSTSGNNGILTNANPTTAFVTPGVITTLGVGVHDVTLTVSDGIGNESECIAQVTVVDDLPPTFTCNDLTINLENEDGYTLNYEEVVSNIEDNCGISSVILSNEELDCTEVGVNPLTITVMDINGNTATCDVYVTVIENLAPVAICKDITVQLDELGNVSIEAQDITERAEDACGIQSTTIDVSSFTCSNVGANTVMLTVTDNNGNIGMCSATVTVEDNVLPEMTCTDITLALDEFGGASITTSDISSGISDACGIDTVFISVDTFSCDMVGRNDVLVTAIDNNGNVSTCTAEVTIIDDIAPVAVCQNFNLSLGVDGTASITADDVDNGSSDICGIASMEIDMTDFDCSHIGPNTVTLTVMDNNDNVTTCEAIVTIEDKDAPEVMCKDITVQLDDMGNASITAAMIDNGSSDACSTPNLTIDISTFTCENVGANTVTLTATDAEGNASICTATVTLEDSIEPTAITQTVCVYLDKNGNASITPEQVDNGSFDNCEIVSIELSDSEFDCDDINTTGSATLVSDADWIQSTVELTTPSPFVSLAGNLPGSNTYTMPVVNAYPYNGSLVFAPFIPGTQPIRAGGGTKFFKKDFILTGEPQSLRIRARVDNYMEIFVNGQSIALESTLSIQNFNNSIYHDVLVDGNGVQNGNAGGMMFDQVTSANILSLLQAGSNELIFVIGNTNGADDGGFTVRMDAVADGIPVQLTVTDPSGNTNSNSAFVIVKDTIAPEAICQNLVVSLDASGNASITAQDVDNGSNDACGIEGLEIDMTNFTCANVGTNTVTLTVTDVNGNESTCESTVTVQDMIAPVAICKNITVSLDDMGSVNITAEDIDNGSNDACGIQSLVLDVTGFDCDQVGDNPVVLIVTDNNGNTAVCNATVTIEDNIDPTFSECPSDQSVAAVQGDCSQLVAWAVPTVSDNCDVSAPVFTASNVSILPLGTSAAGVFPVGTTTVTMTVTDEHSNAVTCTFDITVTDEESPVITNCPADITMNSEVGECGAEVFYGIITASDNCPGVTLDPVTNHMVDGDYFEVGITAVQFIATDASGNATECSFNVTVIDNEDPVITCPSDITVDADAGSCEATGVVLEDATATDNCATITITNDAPTAYVLGDNTVTWSADDGSGNIVTCTQNVTVEDNQAPSITCPADLTVDTDAGVCLATGVALGTPTINDNCMTTTVTNDAPTEYALGETIVTWTIDDGNGQSATCTQTVTVEDNEAPQINCPEDVTITCTDDSQPVEGCNVADAVFTDPNAFTFTPIITDIVFDNSVTDNYIIYNPIFTPVYTVDFFTPVNAVALTYEPLATAQVCTVDCFHNGIAVGSQTLTLEPASTFTAITSVQTFTTYTLTTADATPITFNTMSFGSCPVGYAVSQDNCESTITFSDVSTQDADMIAGNADDYNYTITRTWTATDLSTNATSCTQVITVQDVTNPEITCPANIAANTDAGSCMATGVDLGIPTGSDICSDVTFSNDAPTSYAVGITVVTWTATDASGNTMTCTQDVIITDNELPIAYCNDITIDLPNRNDYVLSQSDIDAIAAGSSDNCDFTYAITSGITTYNCDNRDESFLVTLTVTDASGNEAECDATVNIIDSQSICNDPPMALCQNITINTDENCVATFDAIDIDGGSTDPDGDDLTFSVDNAGPFGVGVYTVTLFTTDGEFEASCTATVTVVDNTPPTVACKDLTTYLDENGVTTISVLDLYSASNDACGIQSIVVDKFNFDCTNIGDNNVTLTVTDVNGNVTECMSTVTVVDEIAPTAVCQDIDVYLDASGEATIVASDVDGGSFDNCGIVSTTIDINSFDCTNIGANEVTLTVQDASGNGAIIPQGLIGHWDFENGSLSDLTGNWGDLILNSNTSIANGKLDLNAGSLARTSSYSGAVIGSKTLVSFLELEDLTTRAGSPLAIDAITVDKFDAIVWAERQTNRWMSGSSFFSRTQDPVPGFAESTTNEPIMIAITYQELSGGNLEITLYRNGVQIGQYTDNNFATWSAGDVEILFGARHTVPSIRGQMNALVDEAMLFDRALTAQEVEDLYGNGNSCVAIVTVHDDIAPEAICQPLTVQLDLAGNATITPEQVDNGSNDACGIASLELDIASFNCDNVGLNSVELTVTDANGNVNTCTSTITVEDNVNPTASCKDITIQLDENGNASIDSGMIDNGSSDACGIASVVIDQTAFDCDAVGNNTVTLTITDNNGNVSECTSTVTVEDMVAPIAECKPLTIQLDANGNATISAGDIDNGSSDPCGIASSVISQSSFDCNHIGTNSVILTITDNNGNSSECTAEVTVQDVTAPIVSCKDITVQVDDQGLASISADMVDNGSYDVCGDVTLEINKTDFNCINVGDNTVILTVTDENGNSAVCNSNVTIEDNIAPTASCQDITIQLNTAGVATIMATNVDNGSMDACGIAGLAIDIENFDCSHIGPNTVTLTVTDNNGNVAECTSTVTVEDMVAPVARCKDITVQLDDMGNASITELMIDNGSNDACGIANLSIDVSSFTCDNVGSNSVTLIVTDNNGNSSECTSTVTVEDNVAPIITTMASNQTVECDGDGNDAALTAWINANGNASATDACGITWTNNFATLSNGCGETGSASVTFTATDDNNNSVSTTATFTIVDTQAPDISCPADIAQCADQGLVSGSVVNWDSPTFSDICGTVSITSTHNSGDVFPVGTTTVTYTATDDCGNAEDCSFDVTIFSLPEVSISQSEQSIYCQSDAIILTANVDRDVSYAWSTSDDSETTEVNESGTYTVVVTDANGCSREATYTVTVDQQDLLAAYTILAEDEAKLTHSSKVLNGGMGVYSFGGKAKVYTSSTVTAPTTFVKADIIQVLSGGSVTTAISDPVSVGLPPFLNNNMPSNNDISVSSGSTVTLTGQVYGDIRVKSGATVIFTQKDVFIERFDVDNYATVKFEDCAYVRVSERLDIDRYTSVNPTGEQVWFYVGDNADVDKGSTVNASIYAPGSNITVKGSSSNPTFMNGQFIARKVQGLDNVTWDFGGACDPGCLPEEMTTEICDNAGGNTNDEWIENVTVNGTSNASGNDGGYGDYTNVTLPIVTGNNNVTLIPGFSGQAYGEYWKIWIDLNNDGDFDDYAETVYSASSSSTINSSFSIPNWATSEPTTMRVAMKYGGWPWACESFEYGEVEDYTVQIDFCHNVMNGGSIGIDQVLCEAENDPAELTNVTSANGGSGAIEYLWLQTNDPSSLPTLTNMNGWSMIANSNSPSYDPGPISETTYFLRCARREGCIDYMGESNMVEVVYTPSCEVIYCDSYGQNSNYEWIDEVSFNNTDNHSGNDGGYGDYRDVVMPLATGDNLISLDPGFSGQSYHEYWTIWIDFNADGDFEDAGEEVYNAHSSNAINGIMNISGLASVDTTVMRIAMKYEGWADPCEVFPYGEVEDYSVTISACNNAVDGGEIGIAQTLCGNENDPEAIVSILDANGGSGAIEYVWLKNTTTNQLPTLTDMNGWEEIPNSNSSSYDPGPISQTTCYLRCARTAGCLLYMTESNVVTMSYAPSCALEYCDSEGESTDYEWIDGVWFGDIDNTSGDNGGYADFRDNHSATINPGSSKTITLDPGFSGQSYNEYWRVWIDWNQDGDFDDNAELVTQKKSKNTINRTISAPSWAQVGTTTMRVSMKYGGYPNPCESFGEGEVEDYTIIVSGSAAQNASIEIRNETAEMIELEAEKLPINMEAYPNPTRGLVTVDFENVLTNTAVLVVTDAQGRTVKSATLNIYRKRSVEVDLNDLPNGIYQLIMKFETEIITKKIIKID